MKRPATVYHQTVPASHATPANRLNALLFQALPLAAAVLRAPTPSLGKPDPLRHV